MVLTMGLPSPVHHWSSSNRSSAYLEPKVSPNYLYGEWLGLRKLDVWILVREIIRTPKSPIVIVKCTDFLGREFSDFGVGGSFS